MSFEHALELADSQSETTYALEEGDTVGDLMALAQSEGYKVSTDGVVMYIYKPKREPIPHRNRSIV